MRTNRRSKKGGWGFTASANRTVDDLFGPNSNSNYVYDSKSKSKMVGGWCPPTTYP